MRLSTLSMDALPADLEEGTRVVQSLRPACREHLQSANRRWFLKSAVSSRVHVSVKSGDTLWSIARRYHMSVRRLMVLNALPSDRIQVGQALWLTEPLLMSLSTRM